VFAWFGGLSWENRVMAYNFAGGVDEDQVFLMPPDPRDWLPPAASRMRMVAGTVSVADSLRMARWKVPRSRIINSATVAGAEGRGLLTAWYLTAVRQRAIVAPWAGTGSVR